MKIDTEDAIVWLENAEVRIAAVLLLRENVTRIYVAIAVLGNATNLTVSYSS